MRGQNRDFLAGLAILLLGLFLARSSTKLGLGAASNPGAGFFAFWIAISLSIMGFFLSVKSTLGIGARSDTPYSGQRVWLKPVLLTVLLGLYGAFFKILGFPVVTFLLIFIVFRWFVEEGTKRAVLLSVSITSLSYLLFSVVLGLSLPEGILSSILRGL